MADVPSGLIAARLSTEFGIGVAQSTLSAYPYLTRLLGLSQEAVEHAREEVLRGDRRTLPGAVRVSASLATTERDVEQLVAALRRVTDGSPAPVKYVQDPHSGHFHPAGLPPLWSVHHRTLVTGGIEKR